MRKRRLIIFTFFTIIILAISLAGCGKHAAEARNDNLTLEVALYPYVPDLKRFQAVVQDAWEREHPDVTLHFADWDCYASDPDPTLDVFVFDGIYLSSFARQGYLLPVPMETVQNAEDIFPFALEGCICGEELYALPQLLCTDLLYTRKNDTALSGISDTLTLYDILGDRKTEDVIPEENEGLLINLSGELFTKTVMYLDALMDEQQEYTDYSELPDTQSLSAEALERISVIWKMGGENQVSYWPEDNDPFVRARWFADGKGRAYIGYAEAMSVMGDYAEDVDVRIFSYGSEKNISLFYEDMVGISAGIDEDKKELAFELANLLISEELLTAMSASAKTDDSPQYLLTPRKSVYDALSHDYPIYNLLRDIVDSDENHVFRMGADVRQFITDMEKTLSEHMRQLHHAALRRPHPSTASVRCTAALPSSRARRSV